MLCGFELTAQHRAGTPWLARPALDAIAMLDMPAWVSVLGSARRVPGYTRRADGHARSSDRCDRRQRIRFHLHEHPVTQRPRSSMGRFTEIVSR